jgi:hypothetical protein
MATNGHRSSFYCSKRSEITKQMTNARHYATHRLLATNDKKKKNPVQRINFVFGKLGK